MTRQDETQDSLHQGQSILAAGEELESATSCMIMVHGRGASAQDILSLSGQVRAPGMAFLAPQAVNNTWYPTSFLMPLQDNEPWLSSALQTLNDLVRLVSANGIPPVKIILMGFSQGACLSAEYVARHAGRFGGLTAFSGGLIGPEGTPRDYSGSLDSTPVFLGCSDVDSHIPVERVYETERVLRELGGDVTTQIYPGMGHTINRDEIEHLQKIVDGVTDE